MKTFIGVGEENVDNVVMNLEIAEQDTQIINEEMNLETEETQTINARKRKGGKVDRNVNNGRMVSVRKTCGECKALENTNDYWFFGPREDLECVGEGCKKNMNEYLIANKQISRDDKKLKMYYCEKVMRGDCEIVMCQECFWKNKKINEMNNVRGRERRQRRKNQILDGQKFEM